MRGPVVLHRIALGMQSHMAQVMINLTWARSWLRSSVILNNNPFIINDDQMSHVINLLLRTEETISVSFSLGKATFFALVC